MLSSEDWRRPADRGRNGRGNRSKCIEGRRPDLPKKPGLSLSSLRPKKPEPSKRQGSSKRLDSGTKREPGSLKRLHSEKRPGSSSRQGSDKTKDSERRQGFTNKKGLNKKLWKDWLRRRGSDRLN